VARVVALDRVEAVAAALRAGELVALPTDTVYGVGAAVSSPASVRALFALKGRPGGRALPVVVASAAEAVALSADWPDVAARLAGAFWPGALTLVVAAPDGLAALVGSGTGRVGLRVPDHAGLLAVLAESGPVALTSANRHGEAPCTTAAEVDAAFAGTDLAGVLDAGRCDAEVSTVVEADGGWRVVRAGAIGAPALAAALRG
jgi:L-threonylcarbamoyladenylate synthase